MATIHPFAALRPRPELASRIAAVPYDVVNADEARRLATDPLSFLHVSRAEIDLPAGTDPYDDAVYKRAASNLRALLGSALLREERPAVYLYRLRMGSHEQTGVAACFSIDEYKRDLIKKHEKTRVDKENDRTRHIVDTRSQSGPVLLTYRQSAAVDAAVARAASAAPIYDFAAADDIRHTVWRTAPQAGEELVQAFAGVPALYIADGHHRAASAARACDQIGQGSTSDATCFLAVAFPDRDVQILPYHRVVKDLAGLSPDSFLEKVRSHAALRPGGARATRKGECAMYVAGNWHLLQIDQSPDAAADAGDPVTGLDVSRLQQRVLGPVLGVGDPRTDKRIDFVGGIRGTEELERLVDSGAAAVAFSMFPTTVTDLMTIADAGGIMPPKSTWFEPKLRDGLLIHEI